MEPALPLLSKPAIADMVMRDFVRDLHLPVACPEIEPSFSTSTCGFDPPTVIPALQLLPSRVVSSRRIHDDLRAAYDSAVGRCDPALLDAAVPSELAYRYRALYDDCLNGTLGPSKAGYVTILRPFFELASRIVHALRPDFDFKKAKFRQEVTALFVRDDLRLYYGDVVTLILEMETVAVLGRYESDLIRAATREDDGQIVGTPLGRTGEGHEGMMLKLGLSQAVAFATSSTIPIGVLSSLTTSFVVLPQFLSADSNEPGRYHATLSDSFPFFSQDSTFGSSAIPPPTNLLRLFVLALLNGINGDSASTDPSVPLEPAFWGGLSSGSESHHRSTRAGGRGGGGIRRSGSGETGQSRQRAKIAAGDGLNDEPGNEPPLFDDLLLATSLDIRIGTIPSAERNHVQHLQRAPALSHVELHPSSSSTHSALFSSTSSAGSRPSALSSSPSSILDKSVPEIEIEGEPRCGRVGTVFEGWYGSHHLIAKYSNGPDYREVVMKEASLYAQVLEQVTGVPKYLGLWMDNIRTVMILSYEGESLVTFGALSGTQKASLAGILQILHEAGIAHGDFAPRNVVVDERGHISLIDFSHSYVHDCEGKGNCSELRRVEKMLG